MFTWCKYCVGIVLEFGVLDCIVFSKLSYTESKDGGFPEQKTGLQMTLDSNFKDIY